MRIKRTEIEPMAFKVLGNVHVGEKKTIKNKKGEMVEIPTSLDYFKVTGEYSYKFYEVFPEPVSKLEITFFDDDDDFSCNERLELRKGKKCFARGDGESFEVYRDGATEYVTTKEKPDLIQELEKEAQAKFKEILTLRFYIKGITDVLGLWQLSTSAEKTSIKGIRKAYDFVKENAGRVMGFPFDLIVKKVASDKHGSKNQYPIIDMVPHASPEHLEKIKNCIENNRKLPLRLTVEVINSLDEPPNGTTLHIKDVEDKFCEPDIKTIPAEGKVELNGLERAEIIIAECQKPIDIIQATAEIKKLSLTPEELEKINTLKNKKLGEM